MWLNFSIICRLIVNLLQFDNIPGALKGTFW
jgi:hypothetical protein